MFIKAKIVLVLGKKPFFFFTVWGIGGEYEKAESENVEGWASWNLCKKKKWLGVVKRAIGTLCQSVCSQN